MVEGKSTRRSSVLEKTLKREGGRRFAESKVGMLQRRKRYQRLGVKAEMDINGRKPRPVIKRFKKVFEEEAAQSNLGDQDICIQRKGKIER